MVWKQVDSKFKQGLELLALISVAICSTISARIVSLPAVILSAFEHTMFVGVLAMAVVLAFFSYLLTEICILTCNIITGGSGIKSQ